MGIDPAQRRQIDALGQRLETAMTTCLAEADRRYKQHLFKEALTLYRQVDRMNRLQVAQRAHMALLAAEKDPALQELLREERATAQWQSIQKTVIAVAGKRAVGRSSWQPDSLQCAPALAAIQRMTEAQQFQIVAQLETLTHDFSTTSAAAEAGELLTAIQNDPLLRARVEARRKEETARQNYELAQQYQKIGQTRRATQLYQKTIDDSPDSAWARKARQDLANLTGSRG